MPWPEYKRRVLDYCKHYPKGVPEGEEVSHLEECDAKIFLVGEAPGKTENRKGIPFQGSAGFLLDRELLQPVSLARRDLYISNVIPFQPPANKFEIVYAVKGFLPRHAEILREKVAAFSGPLIVPLGNNALNAITGKRGIMKWRGSVLAATSHRSQWILPTIHPAAALRQHILVKTMAYDWKRIAGILENGWHPPYFQLIATTWNDRRLPELLRAKVLSVDIETVRDSGKILCVSFCASLDRSYSVDCRHGIPPIVRDLLLSPIPKLLCGGWFDAFVLAENGIRINNYRHDVQLMWHAIDNNVGPTSASASDGKSMIKPYSLAYMASIHTPFPYWKDSAKDEGTGENYGAWKSNWRRFQEYNAMDSLGALWIGTKLLKQLKENNRYGWYLEQYGDLIWPLVDLALTGVRFDVEAAASETTKINERLAAIRNELAQEIGHPLHGVKVFKKEPKIKEGRRDGLKISLSSTGVWIGEKASLSNKELHKYLYKELKLPEKKKDGKVTADVIAIQNLLLYVTEGGDSRRRFKGDKDAARKVLESILEFRETEKAGQFLSAKAVDSDSRIRASYSMLTQTGRLRSYSNPNGTGFNLQNIKRDVRHFFRPDFDDWFFLEIDLKQAEDLVVKAMSAAVTGEDAPLHLVQAVWSGTVDIHKRLASQVFRVPQDAVDYEKRYCAKRCRHAKNNGMQPPRMQQILLKDGFPKTLQQCKEIARAIDEAEPWVPQFHRDCKRAVMQCGQVATSWGWRLNFDGERLTDSSVYRRAFAFIQQSEIGVLMKQWGVLTYEREIKAKFKARLNMCVHDNVVLSTPREELWDVAKILYDALTRERDYGVRRAPGDATVPTRRIAIPAEIKISRRLSCSCDECKKKPALEFGTLPTKEEFYRRLKEWLTTQG